MLRITRSISKHRSRFPKGFSQFSTESFSNRESGEKDGDTEKRQEVPVSEVLRHAQALELFRRSYLYGYHAPNHISVSDIEDLMVQYRSRPSLLLGAYQIGGSALGMASRFLPKDCSNTLNTIVQDATIQQFNDIIRDLQTTDQPHEDTKETIKYHRDFDTQIPTNSNKTSEAASSRNSSEINIDTVAIAATTALYNLLKISKTL